MPVSMKIRYVSGAFARHASLARQRAFTLVELVIVMVLMGILAAVAIPRFADRNAFDAAGFANELTASLKHARKSAVAMRRNVCVVLDGNSIKFTRKLTVSTPTDFACGVNPLPLPGDSINSLDATASGVTLTATAVSVIFSPLGQPLNATTGVPLLAVSPNNWASKFSIAGSDNSTSYVVVEAESGYVHVQ